MQEKSKFLTFLFSLVPGVGHMYLGLMQRGLHFLTLFFGVIFLMIITNLGQLSLFLPVIWFYNVFDALQRYQLIKEADPATFNLEGFDQPLFVAAHKLTQQRWIAYGLIALGGYLLVDKLLHYFQAVLRQVFNVSFYMYDFRSMLLATAFIVIGFLLLRTQRRRTEETAEPKLD